LIRRRSGSTRLDCRSTGSGPEQVEGRSSQVGGSIYSAVTVKNAKFRLTDTQPVQTGIIKEQNIEFNSNYCKLEIRNLGRRFSQMHADCAKLRNKGIEVLYKPITFNT